MNQFWVALAHFIDRIQPGNWSEWFGGIATAGSLFLGFYLIAEARRRDQRAAVAKVGIRLGYTAGKHIDNRDNTWSFEIINRTDQSIQGVKVWLVGHLLPTAETVVPSLISRRRRPVFGKKSVAAWFVPDGQLISEYFDAKRDSGHITAPGETATRVMTTIADPLNTNAYYGFQDESGVYWIRRVGSGKWVSPRKKYILQSATAGETL